MPTDRTGAVIALKRLELAKSRFGGVPAALRERLALAMLLDTCAALAPAVDAMVVVTPVPGLAPLLAPLGAEVLPDPGSGLNPAYAAGAERLSGRRMGRVVACVADLPALRPDDVRAVLAAAPAGARSFLADHTGAGTTMLVADGCGLAPRFEHGSAARHADSGASALGVDAPRARLDVDEPADLAAAARLGVGSATGALWDEDRPVSHDTAVVASASAPGWEVVDSGGRRHPVARTALGPDVRWLRPTQRVHLARDRAGAVRSVWI